LADFGRWPLLPTLNGELAAVTNLHASRLIWQPDEGDWEPEMASGLTKLGIRHACFGLQPLLKAQYDPGLQGELHRIIDIQVIVG
jgi:hypothetical protein